MLSLLGVPAGSAQDDTDGDLLSDDDENNLYFTDPFEPDSDWDGDWDGDEVANGTDPNDPMSNSGSGGGGGGGTDTDGDGLSDEDENNLFGTNPYDTDTDLDGFEDGEEVDEGTDPNDPDSFPGSGGSSGSGGGSGGSGGGGSGGSGSSGDADGDGMTDAWEIAQGLNPNDPTDAGRDFDYDRISHLEEFLNGTDANTDWTFVEIPEGVPLHAVSSLNDLGQLAKVVVENDAGGAPTGFRIRTWNRANGWTDSHAIGDHDGYAPTEVRQNVFGMVAAVFQKYDSVAGRWRGEIRVVNADGGAPVAIGHDQDWGIIDRLAITNSGFVVARFQDFAGGATPTSRVLRWRDGIGRILEGSTSNLYPEGVNERGEIIESGEGVFRGGDWEWLGSSPLGINDRGEVWVADPNGTGAGRWSLSAGYATGYHFNDRADSVAALSPGFESQLENFGNFFDKPASAAEDPLDPVAFVDRDGNERVLTDPVSDAPLAYRRLPIISDINDLGDLGGWYLGHESDSDLWFDDEAGGTASVPEPEGFLWRGGSYSLLGGVDQGSRFHALSNAGQVLVSSLRVESVEVEENLGDVDGDGVDDFQTVPRDALLTRWGMFVPQNDSDGDGLPDGWEAANQVHDPNDDTDGDNLNALQEYALGTDPNAADSDGDGLRDDWEVEQGLSPTLSTDAGEDFDGDGLSNLEEFTHSTKVHSADSDGDGIEDGAEVQQQMDPNTASPIDWTVAAGEAHFRIKGGEVTWADEGFDIVTGETVPANFGGLVYPDSFFGEVGNIPAAEAALASSITGGIWWDLTEEALDYLETFQGIVPDNLSLPNDHAIEISGDGTGLTASGGEISVKLAWDREAAAGKVPPPLTRRFFQVRQSIFEGADPVVTNVEERELKAGPVTNLGLLSVGLNNAEGGETHSLLLVDFEDDQPYSGLDKLSPATSLMIPKDKTVQAVAVTGASPAIPLRFDIFGYPSQPVPDTVDTATKLLTFDGAVIQDDHAMSAAVVGAPAGSPEPLVLTFAVYPERQAEVVIHPIARATPGEDPVPPEPIDRQLLEDHLNSIFLKQANMRLHVTINDVRNVNWDIGTDNDFNSPEQNVLTEFFDMTYRNNRSPEQQAVLAATGVSLVREPTHNTIHVFYIGGCKGIIPHKVHLPDGDYRGWGGGFASGVAHPWFNSCWVNQGEWVSGGAHQRSFFDVVAHEIGHVFIGVGHAENDPKKKIMLGAFEFYPYEDYKYFLRNASPLPRLMVGGPTYDSEITARNLTRGEWEAIQQWGETHSASP